MSELNEYLAAESPRIEDGLRRAVRAVKIVLGADYAALIDEAAARVEQVRRMHPAIEIEPSETICGHCSTRVTDGSYILAVEYPCPTISTLDGIVSAGSIGNKQ